VAVKLHRCPLMFMKMAGHPCWEAQKAPDQAGIDCEESRELVARIKDGRLAGEAASPQ
jgi:hypothetical protein